MALGPSGGPIQGRETGVHLRVNGGDDADDSPVVEIPVDDRDRWVDGAGPGQVVFGSPGAGRLQEPGDGRLTFGSAGRRKAPRAGRNSGGLRIARGRDGPRAGQGRVTFGPSGGDRLEDQAGPGGLRITGKWLVRPGSASARGLWSAGDGSSGFVAQRRKPTRRRTKRGALSSHT